MNILLIPMEAPFDGVKHAGGNIANYYLNTYVEQPDIDVTMITWRNNHEVSKLYYERKGIRIFLHEYPGVRENVYNWLYKRFDVEYASYMFDIPYKNDIEHDLMKLRASGYTPDIIMLQWTQIVLLEKIVKKYYPNVKYILIEEDVSFLGFYRRCKVEKKVLNAMMKRYFYQKIKKKELSIIRRNELTIVNNEKDYRLLLRHGISERRLYRWIPYYHSYREVDRSGHNQYEIIFFGALHREENYTAVIWFIENVMPQLDTCFVFTVIGNSPGKELLKYESERIIFTGFVEDIKPYFSRCLCMVAPLQLGAGIKIKILEGMSAGLPVLTGTIGIEGIASKYSKVYLHCKTAQEYIQAIERLRKDSRKGEILGERAKKHIDKYFDLEESRERLLGMLRGEQ